MTLIRFAPTRHPVVSIVMPTYGAWHWTQQALAAVAERTEAPYEVVVCDNGSTDGTRDLLLDSTAGATLVLNERNLGFSAACNQGAARSRAPYLVFLNSDAIVHANWLPPLLERIADASVGAVAPVLLNLDGSVQEAGALLFGGGEAVLYGDGGEPHDASWAFARDLDYASAVCLLARRSAFNLVGGFDVAFSPAYYEDVDLCFALREYGFRTVYEPRSVVTHVRGASGGTPDAIAFAGLRSRLTSRWQQRLVLRPRFNSANPASVGARDAAAAGRVLMLTGVGGAEAARELATTRPDVRVTLVVGDDLSFARDSLQRDGVEVVVLTDVSRWLAKRRFHYDVVVGGADDQVVATSQPQASRLEETSTVGTIVDALALAPRVDRSCTPAAQ